MKISFILLFVFSILVASAFSINDAFAAGYIKFDGVDGEAQDKDHKGWSDLLSFSESSSVPADSATNRNQERVSGVVVVKELDKSSPKLAESIAKGKVFPKVEIHLTESEGTYYAYELTNVMVTSYSISGTENQVPTEEFSLNYEEITHTEISDVEKEEVIPEPQEEPKEEPVEQPEPKTEEMEDIVVIESAPKVPQWVQTTAQFWIDKDVSDREFTDALGFLVREKIIEVDVEETLEDVEQMQEPQVPDWISTTTGWWINGEVPEDQFLEGIKWMIKNGIIRGV